MIKKYFIRNQLIFTYHAIIKYLVIVLKPERKRKSKSKLSLMVIVSIKNLNGIYIMLASSSGVKTGKAVGSCNELMDVMLKRLTFKILT